MNKKTVVSVLMGSKSDDAHLKPTFELLDEFGVDWEKQVLSAHRNPDKLRAYLNEAEGRGIRVFIAAAGLSAALAGVVAAHSLRPVIGVPVPGGPLQGVDALLSMVQMPSGVPVATVGVGSHGARNAAILALQILSLSDDAALRTLRQYRERMNSG
ncbi:MAG: 5-(carboxyamino)imidazole ribonucleotide mutase [Candidatus Krumholzibacteria bacterium]